MKRALADMFVNCASADEILGSTSAALSSPVFVRGGSFSRTAAGNRA